MSYTVSQIAKITNANILQAGDDVLIENLLTDSRKLLFAESSLFFALNGIGRNGTSFIKTFSSLNLRNYLFLRTAFKKSKKYKSRRCQHCADQNGGKKLVCITA